MFLGLSSFGLNDQRSYHRRYVTVDEFTRIAEPCSEKWMIQGKIVPSSLIHRPQDGYLEFKIKSQTGSSIKVIYPGQFPELYLKETWVMIEGIYSIEQRLLADRVWIVPKRIEHFREEENTWLTSDTSL